MKNAFKVLFLALCFTLHLGSASAQEGAGMWSKVIQALASGVSSINIDNATLGVDKGLIQNLVIGLGRTVERNPKSTSTKDRFLVKDRLKLGLELGAGYVVAGTVTYTQQWTLVYPVATEAEGLLSRKFILDLFLPLTISKWEESALPAEYVVIREAAIEGKGRIRLGDIPGMALGSEHSYGRIKLFSSLAKRFGDQSYKIMQESSKYTKMAHSLWFNMPVIKMPIFDLNYTHGESLRKFYEIKYKDWSQYNKNKLYKTIFKGYINPLTENVHTLEAAEAMTSIEDFLKPYQRDEQWASQFKETTTSFSLFYLFNKETINRTDNVTITHGEDSEEENWWQWEDRRSDDWTIGIRSEAYHSRVLFSGKKEGEDITDPILSVHILMNDSEATRNEIENTYMNVAGELLRSIGQSRDYLNYKRAITPRDYSKLSSQLEVKTFYNEEDLLTLLTADESILKEEIASITTKKFSYWEKAAKEKFHSVDRRRLRQSRTPLHDIAKGREIMIFMRSLRKARTLYRQGGNLLLAYRELCWAFRDSFYVSSFSGHKIFLLKAINGVVLKHKGVSRPTAKMYIQHRLYRGNTPINQMTYSTSEDLIEQMNQAHFPYILLDPSEIFYFF